MAAAMTTGSRSLPDSSMPVPPLDARRRGHANHHHEGVNHDYPVLRCRPADLFGDGHVPEHAEDCPRRHAHIHTVEEVSSARLFLMHWDETAARLARHDDSPFRDHREITARMARGVTARAVELGLEAP